MKQVPTREGVAGCVLGAAIGDALVWQVDGPEIRPTARRWPRGCCTLLGLPRAPPAQRQNWG